MTPSRHTTVYCFPRTLPTYAVRRASDGWFLDDEGNFRPMGGETDAETYSGSRNDYHIDYRTSPNHWSPVPEGCEVVAISEVTTITAVPINW